MYIYMTAGTFEFLKKIETKNINEKMVTMENENGALILHETMNGTIFKEPRRYEVLESFGEIRREGFVVMNNIPVTMEGRPLFEHQLKNQRRKLVNENGFMATRTLRPLSSNTYVILTVWEKEFHYQEWQNSESFFESHKHTVAGGDQGSKIFASAAYLSSYTISV
ncbi:MAG: antibiotic biosynthesis monooxygenase [Bacillus sp. (in: Bacteria)]|nr:antibiotic biosynthesis monooxygenase [Bacillus sp. (in: firmicutes)]